MLRQIRVEDLQEGMMFSEPLFFDDGKNRVLGKMRPLSLRELTVLWQWDVPFVMTAGETIKRERLNKSFNPKALQLPDLIGCSEFHTEYLAIITALDVFLQMLKEHKPLNRKDLDRTVAHVRKFAASDRAKAISFVVAAPMRGKSKAKAAVDTAILAETVALFMRLPEEYIDDIVRASLLHDCGMLSIPDTLLNKKEALSDAEMRIVAAHTMYGYKTVLSECMCTERVARFVLQHHERWDGKGYPNKLAGESIEVGARIIAVSDAFTAMTAQRAYRKAILGYDAMETLLADKGRRFDSNVVKSITKSIGVYPIGSLVLLSNAAVARVVGIAPEAPRSPSIRMLIDENGRPYRDNEGTIIDLRESQDISIIQAIDPLHYQRPSITKKSK